MTQPKRAEEMRIITRGAGSVIAKTLGQIDGVEIEEVERYGHMDLDGELYLFCAGMNEQHDLRDADDDEIKETLMVNAIDVMRECDRLIRNNPKARICVIGSDAAFKWSYNGAYAAAKAALHRYVETKRLISPDQQLVCIAPSMIFGSGMVTRRNKAGTEALEKRLADHPMGRMVYPGEVAHLIHYLLGQHGGFVSGVVIRMNGGEHCQA